MCHEIGLTGLLLQYIDTLTTTARTSHTKMWSNQISDQEK